MLHDFASGCLQHVFGVLCDPTDCVEPDEEFFGREGWSGPGDAALDGPAPRQLAAGIRTAVAPGSEQLVLGAVRLGWNAAGGYADDKAHHQRHRANLWRQRRPT